MPILLPLDPPIQTPLLDSEGKVVEIWRTYFRRNRDVLDALQGLTTPGLFSALPSTPTAGMIRSVSDSTTNVWGNVITGGGANLVLAFWNSVAWTVCGK